MRHSLEIVVLAMLTAAPLPANAALFVLGPFVYDSDLDVTWLRNANAAKGSDYDDGVGPNDGSMTWASAMAWVDQLTITFWDEDYDGWRLPTITDTGDPGCDPGGSGTDCGSNVDPASGEVVHLWQVTLGNKSQYAPDGSIRPRGEWGFINKGPFENGMSGIYWSSTDYVIKPTLAWVFETNEGVQGAYGKFDAGHEGFAWAVHDGNILPIGQMPEPGSFALLGLGLAGLGLTRRRKAWGTRGGGNSIRGTCRGVGKHELHRGRRKDNEAPS